MKVTALIATLVQLAVGGHVSHNNQWLRPHGTSRGVIMAVHGGAWIKNGKASTKVLSQLDWLSQQGYTVYTIDYRQGSDSLADTVAAYDHLRKVVGTQPVCAYGSSAGGQLVQLLAALRPSLSCVVSEGGIENLTALTNGFLAQIVTQVWGPLAWTASPLRVAKRIHQPMLLAGASTDPIVNEQTQLAQMKAARPSTHTLLLQGAHSGVKLNFTHVSITSKAMHDYRSTLDQFLTVNLRSRA